MFLQLRDKFANGIMKVSGFNQPSEFPAKDFIKRQRAFQHIIQILTIDAYHRRRSKSLVRSNSIGRKATYGDENASTDLGVSGNAGIKHC